MAGRGVTVAPSGAAGGVVPAASILLILGTALFLSGQTLFAASFFQGAQGELTTLPPGSQWFFAYEIKVLGPGRVGGQFADPAGGQVSVYVFREDQYKVFEFIGLGYDLFSVQAASGSFSALLPGSGTYYLVFAHGDGSEFASQPVRVSYWVAGIQPAFLGVGLGFIAAGIAGVAVGLSRRRPRTRAPAGVTS